MGRFSLLEKNILITGASSGIGEACCLACAESGANLILLGRNADKLNKVLSKLKPAKHTILIFDLSDLKNIEGILEKLPKIYGRIHGFIHSAGIDITRPLNTLKPEDYQMILNTNLISGFEIARVLSKRSFNTKGASYIFIASVMGMVGESAKIAYSTSKGALIAGCRSMALELAHEKIRVNCISPAIVETNLTKKLFESLPDYAVRDIESLHPLGFGFPSDVANACLFMLSDEARWITGTNLVVDGGYSCR